MFLFARIVAFALLAGSAFPQVAVGTAYHRHPWDPPCAYPDWPSLGPPSVSEAERPHIGGPLVSTYLGTGEFVHDAVDLRIAGRGLDVVIARRNRSRMNRSHLMGAGWHFSYDIAVSADQGGLALRDGNGRRDIFSFQSGNYTAAGIPMTGVINGDQTYTFTFPDAGKWNLRALDGSTAQGKIASIVDRNGNTISFAYGAGGRLTTITDTLARNVTLTYDAAGRIAIITDLAGRQVVYSYYGLGDPNGNEGDLKSVRTPVVTGTPNANDFPSGKTTTYTYFVPSGGSDPSLRHNLLTITDPAGKLLVRNTYGTSGDTLDHLVKQELGSSGESLNLYVKWLKPTNSNGFANHVVIVNDRAGNVSEHYYDGTNRLVLLREFTGRATAGMATTLTTNRPTNKLRPSDPDFFETRWEYNSNSLVTRRVEPELNETLLAYQTTGSQLARFNVVTRTNLAGPRGGDQASHVWSRTYDVAHNLPLTETDPRNNVTTHVRDANGNCTKTTHPIASIVDDWEFNAFGQVTAHLLPADASGFRRRDEYHYHPNGPQNGYLQERVVDAGAGPSFLRLTTTYEYDSLGQVVRTIDPRGNDTLFDVNALGQVVRERSRQVAIGGGVRYEKLFFFDASDNLQFVDIQNVDENGVVGANSYFRTTHEYDHLNRVTRKRIEIASGQEELTEYTYDANGNRAIERFHAAATGASPNNFNLSLFDERDLLFQAKRAPNATGHSTSQFDYDKNGGLVTTRQGLGLTPRVTTVMRDGFDRITLRTDAMGNVATLHYDANGNQISRRLDGELSDVAGSANNVRLEESSAVFDALNRATSRTRLFFNPLTQSSFLTGQSVDLFVIDGLGGIVSHADPTGGVTTSQFDRAHRISLVTDPKGNSVATQYDQNGNVTRTTETSRADSGAPDVVVVKDNVFDAVDRMVSCTTPSGTQEFRYDSRGNRSRSEDELDNATIHAYDGLSRRTSTTRELRVGGTGQGALISTQTMTFVWKQSHLLQSRTDDNGHTTQFVYDDLNRRISTFNADATTNSQDFDVHDDPVLAVDANGSQVTSVFDALGRCSSRAISTMPPVLADTAAESFSYDGRSLLVSAQDDDSLVQREHDSLGALRREIATINVGGPLVTMGTTTITTDAAGAWTRLVYPGGRTIDATRDALHRAASLADLGGSSVTIGPVEYLGPARLERVAMSNNTLSRHGYDSMLRPIDALTKFDPNGANVTRVHRTASWQANAGHLANRANLLTQPGATSFTLTSDSLVRLAQSVETPQSGSPTTIVYTLDDFGNRTQVQGGPDQGGYVMNCAPVPADCQMNQYTQTPFDDRTYDENGNVRALYGFGASADALAYDYANRLGRYIDTATGQVHLYKYDALGRRTAKIVDATGAATETRFFHFGDAVIEEQNKFGASVATYIWAGDPKWDNIRGGQGHDRIWSMRRGGTNYFLHMDALGNMAAVTNGAGNVVERYEYADFGTPRIYNGLGQVLAQSAIGNPHLLSGAWFDAETGLSCRSGGSYLDVRSARPLAKGSQMRPWLGIKGMKGNCIVQSGPSVRVAASRRPWLLGLEGQAGDDGLAPHATQRPWLSFKGQKGNDGFTASRVSLLRPWLSFKGQTGNDGFTASHVSQLRPWHSLKGQKGNDGFTASRVSQLRPWHSLKGQSGNDAFTASRVSLLRQWLSLQEQSGNDAFRASRVSPLRPWLSFKEQAGNDAFTASRVSQLRSWVGLFGDGAKNAVTATRVSLVRPWLGILSD